MPLLQRVLSAFGGGLGQVKFCPSQKLISSHSSGYPQDFLGSAETVWQSAVQQLSAAGEQIACKSRLS